MPTFTIEELIARLAELRNEIDFLMQSVQEVQAGEAQDNGEPTPAEISAAVSGNPDLYMQQPDVYEDMKQYYDPDRVPFTDSSWFTFRHGGRRVDPRGYVDVVIDGVAYHRMEPKSHPGEYYWIGKGVVDVTETPLWRIPVSVAGSRREDIVGRVQNYNGGLASDPNRWPPMYRDAYFSSHAPE